jgi:hypothetical protein
VEIEVLDGGGVCVRLETCRQHVIGLVTRCSATMRTSLKNCQTGSYLALGVGDGCLLRGKIVSTPMFAQQTYYCRWQGLRPVTRAIGFLPLHWGALILQDVVCTGLPVLEDCEHGRNRRLLL